MSNKLEVRFNPSHEVRILDSGENGPKKLAGYAARFMQLSEDLGGFKERIMPGAFAKSLRSKAHPVVALFGHDWNRVLGNTANGTLTLVEDDLGLRFDPIIMPNTTDGNDAYTLVNDGYIAGCSFGFNIVRSTVIEENGELIQELYEIDLWEVSITISPAYPSTSVQARDLRKQIEKPSNLALYEALQRQREIEALLTR